MRKLTGVVSVDVRSAGIHSSERLMHDCDFRPQHLVFLLRVTAVFCISLQTLKVCSQTPLVVLRAFDIIDC